MTGFLTQDGAAYVARKRAAGAPGRPQEGRSTGERAFVGSGAGMGASGPLGPGVLAVPGGRRTGGSLDTLAQLDQNRPNVLKGGHAELGAQAKLQKRARSMFFTKPLATRLAVVAKLEGSPLEKGYRNTYYCNDTLSQEEGKIKGHYCGNRWCMTCSRIRTALATNRYMPVLQTWKDPQAVALTLRNVPPDQLKPTINAMIEGATAAKRAIKRTDKVAFKALRKLECTYNPKTDEYHPHFHFIVEGRRAAKLLVKRWLEYFPERTDAKAQHIRPVDQSDESLRELFKYFTKLVTKGELMPAKALDVIFRSMKGRRVYQPVGFVAPKDAADDEGEIPLDEGTEAFSRPAEDVRWEWSQAAADWVDRTTGECLTGYEPAEKFRKFVESIERQGEQPELLSTVRSMEPEEKIDEAVSRDEMRRRMNALDRGREPDTSEIVSNALRKLFAVTAERAREMAPKLVKIPSAQIGFLDTLGFRPPSRPSVLYD